MQTSNVNPTANTVPANIGRVEAKEVEAMRPLVSVEDIPAFMPGKEGYLAGETLAGFFVETKKVVSEKLTTSKKDENGRKYAYLHILRDRATNAKFGIWGKGQLDGILRNAKIDQFLSIKYLGIAAEPLQKGQSAPHQFDVRGA
jgi:hypothetical protein